MKAKYFFYLVLLFSIAPLASAMSNQEIVDTINNGHAFKQSYFHAGKTSPNQTILWEALNGPTQGAGVKTIQMKNNNSILFAYQPASAKNIFRSLDGGNSWKILTTPQGGKVNDLASIDEHRLILTTDDDVFLSDDIGEHWYASSNGINGYPSDISVVKPQLILLITNKYDTFTNLYRSLDGGKSWTPTNLGLEDGFGIWKVSGRDNIDLVSVKGLDISTNDGEFWSQPSTNWQDWLIDSIAINSKHDIYFAAFSRLLKTNVTGDNWEELKVSGSVKQIGIDDADRIFILSETSGNESQLFRSTDNAKTWQHLFNLKGNSNFTLLDDGRILTSSDAGLLISDKTQIQFTPLPFTFSTSRTSIVFALDDQHLYATDADQKHKLYGSENGGHTWQLVYGGSVDGITSFNQKLVIAADSKKILTSDDFGKTWRETYTFADDTFINLSNYTSTILLQGYEGTYITNDLIHWQKINTFNRDDRPSRFDYYIQGDTVYFNKGDSIQVSKDKGKTWTILLNNIHRYVGYIKGSGSTLVAAFSYGGVIKSTDCGVHWRLINNGLLNSYFNSLLVLDEKNYWIATSQGIFHTGDGGENWRLERNGLTNPAILSLFADNHQLLAGSNGNGVYKAKLN